MCSSDLDAVFPYKELLQGNILNSEKFGENAREFCEGKTLKIILENGELKTTNKIIDASKISIDNGADFIKTSTGKTEISATPEAANAILETIKSYNINVGFKASGGIKTLEDAKKYLLLSHAILGPRWANAQNFRIGASSLLDDLIETIKRGY